jgi:RNA polymerase sigma-70 factor (ECF subfamily)
MSLETIVQRLAAAFEMLNRRAAVRRRASSADVRPRSAPRKPVLGAATPDLGRQEFEDEALPWMATIHRFALSLTRGDGEAAADLVQDTYIKAFKAWDTFESGTNCRAWLFRICRNTFLHQREKASMRREITESELGEREASRAVRAGFERAGDLTTGDPADIFADQQLDERVVDAIDALPDDYRNTLILSDIGDLSYREVATVLDVPIGTVRSRLFRARRRLQVTLVDYAKEAGYTGGGTA